VSGGSRPALLITFDTELFWGLFFLPRFADREREMAAVRPALARILRILDDRDLPATFAVVGRLFLPDGVVGDGPMHPDLPAGWAEEVGRGRLRHPEAWFGRDVVEAIRAARAAHEIGGHGFAHLDFDRLDAAGAEEDVRATRAAAAAAGLTIRSWVFPRNRILHEDALTGHDIVAWRAAPPPRARALRLLDLLRARGPLTGRPRVSPHGPVELPAGIPFLGGEGLRRLLTRGRRRVLIRRGLEEALREGTVLHLWSHPHNFVRRGEALLAAFEETADAIAAARDRDGLLVTTMAPLAERALGEDGA
jgi:peptidoglycan/xylan/chitin deacetylase (PgdA/CDA1 family)